VISVATHVQINEELTLTLEEQKLTGWSCGPTAGQYLGPNKLLAAVEVSDQNLPKMAEHVVSCTFKQTWLKYDTMIESL
jgi:hypothetical protein